MTRAARAARIGSTVKQSEAAMKLSKLLVASAGLLSLLASSAQAVNVRWLHIEQNPEVAAFYTDVAKRFEAAHPGVKVEIQYLENEAYKKKLTTLLQSPDRPNIIYSWGGGVLREQVKAGVIEDSHAGHGRRPGGALQSRPRCRPTPSNGKVYGVPMHDLAGRVLLQQGSVRQGRRRRRRDQDLGRPARRGEEAAGRRHHADHRRRRRQVAAALLLVASGDPHRRQGGVRRRAARRGQGLCRRDLRAEPASSSSSWPTSSRSSPASSARPIRNRRASSATARAR